MLGDWSSAMVRRFRNVIKMTNLEQLQQLIANKQIHHCTYRNIGTLWEGLWIYTNDSKDLTGFDVGTAFFKNDTNLFYAEQMLRANGYFQSVGAQGDG